MDRTSMPSSVPFAARPFPNSNGVIFCRIHSVPVIRRAVGSESSAKRENKNEALPPYDSKAEASKSRGNRLPRSFQEKLDERATRGEFSYHHLLGIDVSDKFKFKKEDEGKEQESIPIEDGIIIEEDDCEDDDDDFEPPDGGIPYDGKSTKPEDIVEWVRTWLSFGDKI